MRKTVLSLTFLFCALTGFSQAFRIGPEGYFRNEGVDVMAFYDFYPEGHQGGVCVIMNGNRVATNGDLRFEATPGQWQPVPRQISREVLGDAIVAKLAYPDSSRHLTGFNPMVYPDVVVEYTVTTRAVGDHIEVTLDLDRPIPEAFIGKAGFNLEFFPGSLFGKPWIMDGQAGIYPRLTEYRDRQAAAGAENPYGVPYRPSIWGAGWDIQRFGYQQYFLVSAYPDLFAKDPVFDALHFVLGCHPGTNTASFASGVGAVSATTAYGTTRADWSYVPGGVISGTAIIRPDLPELLVFPFLWQQTEYVLGGGSSHYMFLVLATKHLLENH